LSKMCASTVECGVTSVRWPISDLFNVDKCAPDSLLSSDDFYVIGSDVCFCMELELNRFGVDPYSLSFLYLSIRDFNDEPSIRVRFRVWIENSEGKKMTSDRELEEEVSLPNGNDRFAFSFRNETLIQLVQQFNSTGVKMFACCTIRQSASAQRPISSPVQFRQKLWSARAEGITGYCTIVTADQEFLVAKDVLVCQSEVFKRMLLSNSIEAASSRIVLKEVRPEVIESLIFYLYLGKPDKLETLAEELFILADKYNIEKLKMQCLHFIVRSTNESNFLSHSVAAYFYNSPVLKRHLLDYSKIYKERFRKAKLMETNKWRELCARNPTLADTIKQEIFDPLL